MLNRLLLVTAQTLGYLWHFLFFALILPYLVLRVGQDLDWLLLTYLFKPPINWGVFAEYLNPILMITAGTLIVLGINLIVRAWLVLAKQGKFFPWGIFPHQALAPKVLVKSDVYGLCRHPMLLGYGLSLVGLAVGFRSPLSLFWMIPLIIFLILEWLLRTEERELRSWFGAEYEEYQATTPALIPRLKLP